MSLKPRDGGADLTELSKSITPSCRYILLRIFYNDWYIYEMEMEGKMMRKSLQSPQVLFCVAYTVTAAVAEAISRKSYSNRWRALLVFSPSVMLV